MNRTCIVSVCLLCVSSFLFAAPMSARQIADAATKKGNVLDSIAYIKTQLDNTVSAADKRATYAFLGTVQEQLSLFQDASASYAAAAGIAAGDAKDMPRKSSEQLVIDDTGPVSFPLIPGVSPSGIEALHLLRRPTVRLSKALPGRSLPGGAFVFRGLSLYSRISRKRRKCVRVGRPLPGPPGVVPAIQGGVFRAFVPLSLGSLSRSHSR